MVYLNELTGERRRRRPAIATEPPLPTFPNQLHPMWLFEPLEEFGVVVDYLRTGTNKLAVGNVVRARWGKKSEELFPATIAAVRSDGTVKLR